MVSYSLSASLLISILCSFAYHFQIKFILNLMSLMRPDSLHVAANRVAMTVIPVRMFPRVIVGSICMIGKADSKMIENLVLLNLDLLQTNDKAPIAEKDKHYHDNGMQH